MTSVLRIPNFKYNPTKPNLSDSCREFTRFAMGKVLRARRAEGGMRERKTNFAMEKRKKEISLEVLSAALC